MLCIQMLVSHTHPKHPQSNFHCTVIELVCTASLISGSNLYPLHLPTPQQLRADSFISLLQYVGPLQERCSEYLNILGTITLPIICNTNDSFPVFYDTSVLCFISLHLVFSLIFFLLRFYRSNACTVLIMNIFYSKRRKMIMVILKRPDAGLYKKKYVIIKVGLCFPRKEA